MTKATKIPDRLVCKNTVWITPWYITERVHRLFGFFLDPATEPSNPTEAKWYFTEEDDGLNQDWSNRFEVFVNPPYGADTPKWCEKIAKEAGKGTAIVALLPCGARFATRYFQKSILSRASSICFIDHRVNFVRVDGGKVSGNNYDSALYGFNCNPYAFQLAFGDLGVVIRSQANFNKHRLTPAQRTALKPDNKP